MNNRKDEKMVSFKDDEFVNVAPNRNYIDWAKTRFLDEQKEVKRRRAVNFIPVTFGEFRSKFKAGDIESLISDYMYIGINTPSRVNERMPGYYFSLYKDLSLKAKEKLTIPTGLKVILPDEIFLCIYPVYSNIHDNEIALVNTIQIIDTDHYENEGHILISIENMTDHNISLRKGQKYAQGVFQFKEQYMRRKIYE